MTQEEMCDLLFLGCSIGDEVASQTIDRIPPRHQAKERAIRKGWVVFKRQITDKATGDVADIFTMTPTGKARLEELGGHERLTLLARSAMLLQ